MAENTMDSGILPEAVEALQLDGSLFMPDQDYPIWQYIGPLDDIREWFEEKTHTESELSITGIFTLTSFLHSGKSLFWPQPPTYLEIRAAQENIHYIETSAESYEDVWRKHLGAALLMSGQPYADIGVHGETLEELRELLSQFDRKEPDYSSPGNDAEHELYRRWLKAVIEQNEIMGYRTWVKDMGSRA